MGGEGEGAPGSKEGAWGGRECMNERANERTGGQGGQAAYCVRDLYEVVEYPQPIRVRAVLHVEERADLGARERDVLAADLDLELLPSAPVLSVGAEW